MLDVLRRLNKTMAQQPPLPPPPQQPPPRNARDAPIIEEVDEEENNQDRPEVGNDEKEVINFDRSEEFLENARQGVRDAELGANLVIRRAEEANRIFNDYNVRENVIKVFAFRNAADRANESFETGCPTLCRNR